MTLEELKALCKKGTCPRDSTLRAIELFIQERHKTAWRSGDRKLYSTHANEVLAVLEIDVILNIEMGVRCLLNPKYAIKIFKGEHDFNVVDSRNLIDEYLIIDGVYYYHHCVTTYHTVSAVPTDGRSPNYVATQLLSWKCPPVYRCKKCDVTFLKSDMVYNEFEDDLLDIVCNHRVNNHQNARPDLGEPVSSYHSHKTSWKFLPRRKGKEKSIPMGIELEMHSSLHDSQNGAKDAARSILVDTIKDTPDYYFEWDGSLASGGFEMIANPMTLEYAVDWWSKMLPIIRKVCLAYGVEKHFKMEGNNTLNYGIHITMARKGIPDSVLVKLNKFFDFKENKDFIQAIAQRNILYGGYHLGSKDKPNATDSFVWDKERTGSLQGKTRSQPINIKGKLVEFRMFRSTLNTVSFLKNMEFLDALTSYYKESLGNNPHYHNFLVWLSRNIKRYPNLVAYLQHPFFFVKGVGKIKNTWLPFVKELKLRVNDPFKEYGPKPIYSDQQDQSETSMVGAE